jgi:hypothetical protein
VRKKAAPSENKISYIIAHPTEDGRYNTFEVAKKGNMLSSTKSPIDETTPLTFCWCLNFGPRMNGLMALA